MRIGLRLRRKGSSARSSGGNSSRKSLRRAGKPVGARAIDRGEAFEEALRLRRQLAEGDQGRRQLFGDRDELAHQRVGVRVENDRSAASVSFDWSRKVGKARKSSSMSVSRWAVVWKTVLELRIRLGQLALAAAQRSRAPQRRC